MWPQKVCFLTWWRRCSMISCERKKTSKNNYLTKPRNFCYRQRWSPRSKQQLYCSQDMLRLHLHPSSIVIHRVSFKRTGTERKGKFEKKTLLSRTPWMDQVGRDRVIFDRLMSYNIRICSRHTAIVIRYLPSWRPCRTSHSLSDSLLSYLNKLPEVLAFRR